ncbi:hypothetical protein CPSG_09783 [Coccidioides posadasii str. Silveira]|uniref:Uncharacterized protein n=1 Tax=Coccidioides posadasii (strain RMSCC 757 / Silveira) TaxID=443226 RepID=E9DIY4_COCPS|nr:hypothetical protein CPSG_09783 [Coccidioides posadasii str. Silveira]
MRQFLFCHRAGISGPFRVYLLQNRSRIVRVPSTASGQFLLRIYDGTTTGFQLQLAVVENPTVSRVPKTATWLERVSAFAKAPHSTWHPSFPLSCIRLATCCRLLQDIACPHFYLINKAVLDAI